MTDSTSWWPLPSSCLKLEWSSRKRSGFGGRGSRNRCRSGRLGKAHQSRKIVPWPSLFCLDESKKLAVCAKSECLWWYFTCKRLDDLPLLAPLNRSASIGLIGECSLSNFGYHTKAQNAWSEAHTFVLTSFWDIYHCEHFRQRDFVRNFVFDCKVLRSWGN